MKVVMVCLMVLGALLVAGVPGAAAQSGNGISPVGVLWQLVSFGAPGGEIPVVAGSSPTLELRADNQVVGSGGCNSYGGSYALGGNNITFTNIASTLMACENAAVMQQEQAFFAALQSAGRFELTNDQLAIWYNSGQQMLRFARQGAAPDMQVPQSFEDLNSPVGLVASYYNAINRQEYQRAYSYWENPPNPYNDFANGFADTASVRVIVEPPTFYDGAAGSLYVAIPTVLIAQHTDGSQLWFSGCFVTRKSNLDPPDIPEPDVWHLYRADVVQVPNGSDILTLLAQACQPQ